MYDTKENGRRSEIATTERSVACRRELLKTVGVAVTTGGIGTSMAPQPAVGVEQADIIIEIDNIGITAWEITNIDGDEDVAEVGTENPDITLTEGTRYAFKNEAWDNYPLVFRDGNLTEVLSQDGEGEFEDNDAVNWVDNDDRFAFTLTEGLGDNIAEYLATSYSNMQGNILTQPFKPVTLSGRLTGVFDTDSGFVRANTSEGNIDTGINDDGSFTIEVPIGDSFNIAYLETNTTGFPPVINNSPDVYQLYFVSNINQDRELRSVELPEAHKLEITVFDPDGQPLEGIATWVRSVDKSANARYGWFTSTETGGIYQFAPDGESGIELGGKVEITVEPENPERNANDPRVPDEPVTQELVVNSDTSVNLYLITVQTYTNDSDIITISGVSDAISDWQAGRIGVGLVSEVISAWQSGDPVM